MTVSVWQAGILGGILISFFNNYAMFNLSTDGSAFVISNLVQMSVMLALMCCLCPVAVQSEGKQAAKPYQVKMNTGPESDEEIVMSMERDRDRDGQ